MTGVACHMQFATPLEAFERKAFSLLWMQYQHSSEKPASLHVAMTCAMRASASAVQYIACFQHKAQARMRTCQAARPTPLPQNSHRRHVLKWHPFVRYCCDGPEMKSSCRGPWGRRKGHPGSHAVHRHLRASPGAWAAIFCCLLS